MSVLSRVNWQSQLRLDIQHMLMAESFNAFDLRSIISSMTGSTGTYVLRGMTVVGKNGLSAEFSVANSIIFNPQDQVGSFYVGAADDADVIVELPANQSNIFVEAFFTSVSTAPVNQAYWDPLALNGADASGAEFSASTNTQIVIQLTISVNTVGFTPGALPLMRASTDASSILTMTDCRPLFFRLGTGGASPDPLNRYPLSSTRQEPVYSGAGVGEAVDSSWRSKDANGAINDKSIDSFKAWCDVVMTRISEIAGSALWYSKGPISNLSLAEVFFDSIGHSIQPSENASFIWHRNIATNLVLGGNGTVPLNGVNHTDGLIKWQSNYGTLQWQLGGTFVNKTTNRSYAAGQARFESPSPVDGGNVYLKLERDVIKGSGASLSWQSNSQEPLFLPARSISGNPGDFFGVALGDYVRKESAGFTKYYKVVKMSDGVNPPYLITTAATANKVADALITCIELEADIDGSASFEPLRYFRSRYDNSDLYADQTSGVYNYQDVDFYWLGRREATSFILRGYGTMSEGEEVTTLNDSFVGGGSGDGSLVLDHATESYLDQTSHDLALKVGSGTLLTVYKRKRNNLINSVGPGDNSGALLSYTITAPITGLTSGTELWARLSDTTSGVLASGVVTSTTDDDGNTHTDDNVYEVRTAANAPLRSYDDVDIYLLARVVTLAGQTVAIFSDGTMVGQYGRLIDQSEEITGELRLTRRANKGILFVSDQTDKHVDDDAAEFFYDKTNQVQGTFNFRTTASKIDVSAPTDISVFSSMGDHTVTIGSADSTTYIPGDLIVVGSTVAIQTSQLQVSDKIITVGVGDALNGGYSAGMEVADNTLHSTSIQATMGSNHLVLVFPTPLPYVLGDVIGISASVAVGGIPAGYIGGKYTIVATPSAAGQASVSGSTLTIQVTDPAPSSETSTTAPTPSSFKSEWSFLTSGPDGSAGGFTSWKFTVKNVATEPTITPVASYGIVPTANSINMQQNRIAFVNNDNAGPAGADTTLNFTSNLTWDNSTNSFYVGGNTTVAGNLVPGTDNTFDLGSPVLEWRGLHLGSGAGSGIVSGTDTNLYRESAGVWATDNSLHVSGYLKLDEYQDFKQLASPPVAPAVGYTRVWASTDGTMDQMLPDGNTELLTNFEGNVYHQQVTISTVGPYGNNTWAPFSGPFSIAIPKDTNALMGNNLQASVTNGSAVVTVYRINHEMLFGDTVTVLATTAIGGISGANLSVSAAPITVIDSDHFSYVALASATSTASGNLDKTVAFTTRKYIVGSDELEIYWNGQLLSKNVDWSESGAVDTLSNIVLFTLSTATTSNNVITFRIDSNGGQRVIGTTVGGNQNLQSVYNNGNTISVTTGIPVTITGTPGTKLLNVQGDVTITGVIDPAGMTLTQQASDPLPAVDGIWVNTNGELIQKRPAHTDVNITTSLSGLQSSVTSLNGSVSTLNTEVAALQGQTTNPSTFITAGAALGWTGSTLDVKVDNDSIEVFGDALRVKNANAIFETLSNNTGSLIPAGSLVAASTTVNNSIVLATAATLAQAQGFIGIVFADIADGASGKVQVAGIATVPGAGLIPGQPGYLSTTAGLITSGIPILSGSATFSVGVATSTTQVLIQPYLVGVKGNIYNEVYAALGTETIGTSVALPLDSRNGNAARTYTVGSGELEVYLNGQKKEVGTDYTESSSSAIVLSFAMSAGEELTFRLEPTEATISGSGGGGGGGVSNIISYWSSGLSFIVVHGWNSKNVRTDIYDNTTGDLVVTNVSRTLNTITFTSSVDPSTIPTSFVVMITLVT